MPGAAGTFGRSLVQGRIYHKQCRRPMIQAQAVAKEWTYLCHPWALQKQTFHLLKHPVHLLLLALAVNLPRAVWSHTLRRIRHSDRIRFATAFYICSSALSRATLGGFQFAPTGDWPLDLPTILSCNPELVGYEQTVQTYSEMTQWPCSSMLLETFKNLGPLSGHSWPFVGPRDHSM